MEKDLNKSSNDESIFTQRKSSRKQWSLQSEPRTILQRMRSQFAEDGCQDSQYLTAKILLENKFDDDYEDNARQAVYWLTQASLQGSVEATTLLKDCLDQRKGITELNYLDVKKAIEMDHNEKIALVASKKLFESTAEGNDFVTQKRLEEKLSEARHSKETVDSEHFTSCNGNLHFKKQFENEFQCRRWSCSDLSSVALEIVKGETPSILLCEDHIKIGPFLGLGRFCSVTPLLNGFIEAVVNRNLESLFSVSNIFVILTTIALTVVILLLRNYINSVSIFLVCVIWIASFFVLITSLCHILARSSKKKFFNSWLTLLNYKKPDFNAALCDSKYEYNTLRYYVIYFSGIFLYVLCFPFVPAKIVNIMILPCVIKSVFVLFFLFRSNVINILLSSFYIAANCRYVQELVYSTLEIFSPEMSICADADESKLNVDALYVFFCGATGKIFIVWYFVLILCSIFSGSLRIVFNHAICVAWFHLNFMTLEHFQYKELYLTLIVLGVLLLLKKPFALFNVLVSAFAFVAFYSVYDHDFTFIGLLSIGVYAISNVLRKFDLKFSALFKCLILSACLSAFIRQNTSKLDISDLEWREYQQLCSPRDDYFNLLNDQKCLSLKGAIVQWEAQIHSVHIKSFYNIPSSTLSALPPFVQTKIRPTFCLFASNHSFCPSSETHHFDFDNIWCRIDRFYQNYTCDLSEWNVYEFKIEASMDATFFKFSKSKSDAVLYAGNDFKEFIFKLSPRDKIIFVGTLKESLTAGPPEIDVLSIARRDSELEATLVQFSSNSHPFPNLFPYIVVFYFLVCLWCVIISRR